MSEVLHPDDRERARIAVETAIADRSDYDVEYRIRTKAGERWVAVRGHAAYSPEGTVLGMLGIVSLGYYVQDARARQYHDAMFALILLGSAIVLAGSMIPDGVPNEKRRSRCCSPPNMRLFRTMSRTL